MEDIQEFEQEIYKKVGEISFGLFSPSFIKKMASVKIVTPELYDKEGYPVDGGLMDTRMGVIDPGLRCRTCGGKLKECSGHFGYIELARPVMHIKFTNLILDLLRSTCRECGHVLIPKEKIAKIKKELDEIEKELGLKARREKIKEVIKSLKTINKCPYCKAKQEKITLEKPYTFIEDDKKLSPIQIRSRLEKIPDEDCEIFGINPKTARPEWAVLTIMPIPPVTIRPSITLESGERSEDDLTHKLGDIVRINQRLFENINAGAPEIIIEDLWDLLQYHITTYFDNTVSQLPVARHRSGQPLKTLTQRIKSKEGRIRHNLAGKRVNFSSRSVISPDPMLKLNEVGVPLMIAMKLTIPEKVTDWNINYLKKFVEKGPKIYPGASYIIRPDGKRKNITDEMKEQILEELQPGYIVERHLMDGDVALFNRQPSLHRLSMMCHRVKVLPGKTFRLNPAVCHPYNADFDGDEMNLHIPQTEEARAEAEILMEVQTQLVSPRYGLSVIGAIQDAITGNYLLTRKEKIARNEAIMLLASIGLTNFSKLSKKNFVSGREIFGCLLPDGFNFIGKSNSGEEVIIKNGKLIKGVMDSSNLGHEAGLMLRNLHKIYGADSAIKILGDITKLGATYLTMHGFTTSISDTDLPEYAKQTIREVIKETYVKVNELIEIYNKGELEALPGKSISETLEVNILMVLNEARNKAGKVVSDYSAKLGKETGTLVMIRSGARGKPLNLAQMSAIVGQQALRGKRVEKGFKDRVLSHFKRGDLTPKARGFVESGFKYGLNPAEFFFMGVTGRDSLMDTALRTPKSGYLYRRLANALQDLKVEYDNTVRDSAGRIIQFIYGEDGMDVSKSEAGTINVKRIIKEELYKG